MLPIYRGRRENGSWISGCLIYDPESMQVLGIISNDPDVHPLDMPYMDAGCIDGYFPTVDPETIGMCTGLNDRNGVWIFEGDIIFIPRRGKAYEVKYQLGQFYIGINLPIAYERYNCEVIGNIHDNPELLEV